jgi:hypothetical protein
MKIYNVIYVGILVVLLNGYASMVYSKSKTLGIDNNDKKSISMQQKANQLGVDLSLYRKLALIAQGYDSLSHVNNAVDIGKHPATLELSILTDSAKDIPDVLRDEVSNLVELNYSLAAAELNLSEDKFYKLLVAYIQLNNQLASLPDDKSQSYVFDDSTLSRSTDDDDDDEEPPVEVVVVIGVSSNGWNEVLWGGANGLSARLQRDATVRWGARSGTVVAVFTAGHSTLVRVYHYTGNGIFFPFSHSCVGQCVATIDGSL